MHKHTAPIAKSLCYGLKFYGFVVSIKSERVFFAFEERITTAHVVKSDSLTICGKRIIIRFERGKMLSKEIEQLRTHASQA